MIAINWSSDGKFQQNNTPIQNHGRLIDGRQEWVFCLNVSYTISWSHFNSQPLECRGKGNPIPMKSNSLDELHDAIKNEGKSRKRSSKTSLDLWQNVTRLFCKHGYTTILENKRNKVTDDCTCSVPQKCI